MLLYGKKEVKKIGFRGETGRSKEKTGLMLNYKGSEREVILCSKTITIIVTGIGGKECWSGVDIGMGKWHGHLSIRGVCCIFLYQYQI